MNKFWYPGFTVEYLADFFRYKVSELDLNGQVVTTMMFSAELWEQHASYLINNWSSLAKTALFDDNTKQPPVFVFFFIYER